LVSAAAIFAAGIRRAILARGLRRPVFAAGEAPSVSAGAPRSYMVTMPAGGTSLTDTSVSPNFLRAWISCGFSSR
jgi:hypothetical protein